VVKRLRTTHAGAHAEDAMQICQDALCVPQTKCAARRAKRRYRLTRPEKISKTEAPAEAGARQRTPTAFVLRLTNDKRSRATVISAPARPPPSQQKYQSHTIPRRRSRLFTR
jgi:hypothetical protein